MRKIYNAFAHMLAAMTAALTLPDVPVDPTECLSPRERADLPVYHPRCDDCTA